MHSTPLSPRTTSYGVHVSGTEGGRDLEEIVVGRSVTRKDPFSAHVPARTPHTSFAAPHASSCGTSDEVSRFSFLSFLETSSTRDCALPQSTRDCALPRLVSASLSPSSRSLPLARSLSLAPSLSSLSYRDTNRGTDRDTDTDTDTGPGTETHRRKMARKKQRGDCSQLVTLPSCTCLRRRFTCVCVCVCV